MIDTVKFRLLGPEFLHLVAGWEFEEGTRTPMGEEETSWVRFQHKESGLRLFGSEGRASYLEVSLPRLFHGCNGTLLRPEQVNMAYFAALDLASQVCALEFSHLEKLMRLDLVHHFDGWAFDFVASLKGLKHTGVRRKQVEWFESGLEWPGKNLYLRLYDKKMELSRRPGRIQRLEAQLRGKRLPKQVWSATSGFDVELCYREYREICSGFSSRKIPVLGSIEDLLCWLKDSDVTVKGICPVERFLASRSRASRYRIQKALNGVSLDFFEAAFMDHLPEDIRNLTFLDCLKDSAEAGPFGCPAGLQSA